MTWLSTTKALILGIFLMLTMVKPAWGVQNYCNGNMTTNPQVNTALGCIPVDPAGFVGWLLPSVFGIAGGIAFLLMVYGFILMATSGGDPKVLQGAKETVTSAITGLLVCIFSLFLLRLIAVGILKIPGIN